MLMKLAREESHFRHYERNIPVAPLEIEAPKDLPPLYADLNLLIQVFLNLFANAYDAMEGCPEKKITVKAYLYDGNSDFVQVEVSDSGSGVPPELKEKVWEYLFTTKKATGGSGIGLFWCRIIMESIHQGAIWFESEPGRGATFFLKIPVWKDEKHGRLAKKKVQEKT